MTNEIGNDNAPPRNLHTRPSLGLDVAGGGLLLRGRFGAWQSGLSLGPDLDRVRVRLAVDSTSAAGAGATPCLFEFHSRSVEPAGDWAYRARGTFTGATGSRPLEVLFETPPGHTAIFALSFPAEKSDFGDGWSDLLENVVPDGAEPDGGDPVRPRAWLTPPVLAAA